MSKVVNVKIGKIPMIIKWDGPGHYRIDRNFDQILSGKPIYADTIAELKESLKMVFDIIGIDLYGTMDNSIISRVETR